MNLSKCNGIQGQVSIPGSKQKSRREREGGDLDVDPVFVVWGWRVYINIMKTKQILSAKKRKKEYSGIL